MFYLLYEWWCELPVDLRDCLSPVRALKYVTVRTLCGAGTSFALSLLLGPWVIGRLRRLKVGQYERKDDAPALYELHAKKEGTPTMGGLLIIFSVVLATLLWAMPSNALVWVVIATMCYMGLVGFWDDYLKTTRKDPRGLRARNKFALEVVWALAVFVLLLSMPEMRGRAVELWVPFLKEPLLKDMGLAAGCAFLCAVLVGACNAVNLTDGVDGLAVGCCGSAALSYLMMSYVAGHAVLAQYLLVPRVNGAGELAVVCGCLAGGCLGFLWYNCHPADVFMGDTGSLALGGAIGVVAVLIKQELVLLIVGGVFVVESLSVIAQVLSFKLTGKRVFAMAPLHHHFEMRKWSETQVTVRFWIFSIICAFLGVLTMKVR